MAQIIHVFTYRGRCVCAVCVCCVSVLCVCVLCVCAVCVRACAVMCVCVCVGGWRCMAHKTKFSNIFIIVSMHWTSFKNIWKCMYLEITLTNSKLYVWHILWLYSMNSIMSAEWWSEEDFAGNRHSFIEVLFWHLSGENEENSKTRSQD